MLVSIMDDHYLLLFAVPVLLYLLNQYLLIYKRNKHCRYYLSSDKFEYVLKKLSLDMNNQEVKVSAKNETNIFSLIKYQNGNKWGIKLVKKLNDNNADNELEEKLLSYSIPFHKILNNDILLLSIDLKNDNQQLALIMNSILFYSYQYPIETYFKFTFIKGSLQV